MYVQSGKERKIMTIDESLSLVHERLATNDAYTFNYDANGELGSVKVNRESEFMLALATLVVHLMEKEDV